MIERHIVSRTFLDVGHVPNDQSDGRKRQRDHAAWEIHPDETNRSMIFLLALRCAYS